MLRAIIDAFAQQGTWDDITELQDVRFTIATDVTNPLCGPEGAAHVFAPQKGATPEMVQQLDAIAQHFADLSAKHFGFDRQNEPGAGAAGGLGYAFLQYMNAGCRSGIELLLEAVGFESLLQESGACGPHRRSYRRSSAVARCRLRPCGMHQSPRIALRGSHEARSRPAEHQIHCPAPAQIKKGFSVNPFSYSLQSL